MNIKNIKFFDFLKNKPIAVCFLLSLIVNLFLWFFIFLKFRSLPEQIILHYDVLIGVDVDWIDSKKYIFLTPLAGLIIFFINFILAAFTYHERRKILNYFFCFASLLTNLLLVISLFLIINLN